MFLKLRCTFQKLVLMYIFLWLKLWSIIIFQYNRQRKNLLTNRKFPCGKNVIYQISLPVSKLKLNTMLWHLSVFQKQYFDQKEQIWGSAQLILICVLFCYICQKWCFCNFLLNQKCYYWHFSVFQLSVLSKVTSLLSYLVTPVKYIKRRLVSFHYICQNDVWITCSFFYLSKCE